MQGYTREEIEDFVTYLNKVEETSEIYTEASIASKSSDIICQLLGKVDWLEDNSGRINY